VYRSGERVAGGRVTQLTWLDRHGKPTAVVGGPNAYDGVWLSPDGTRAAVIQAELAESGLGNVDLWTMDVARGVMQRVTSHPGSDRFPVWSPKGDRLIFMSVRSDVADLYAIPSGGSAPEELLLKTDRAKIPTHWSSNGRFLLYQSTDPKTGPDIWLLPLESDPKPMALIQSEFAESAARFSPDVKWIAYVSDRSGRPEVYVRPFTAAAPASSSDAIRVSNDGGQRPRWRRDSRELVFEDLDGGIMAADLAIDGTSIQPRTPRRLFTVPQGSYWDVTLDGQRFLVTMPTVESGLTPITVLLNWPAK
jgi:Tol biopolymer transport system component